MMLRHLVRNTVRCRFLSCSSMSCSKSVGGELTEQVEDSNDSHPQEKIKISSPQTTPNILVTKMPFAELPSDDADIKIPTEFAEYIDSLGPPLPVAFNLAAYVNQSETLQKLIQLGVDLSKLEEQPEKAKYILQLDFEKDIKSHIKFLHDLGIEAELLGRFITKNPFIFKENIQDMEVRINYLKSKRFLDSAISRIIGDNPYILSWDTKKVDSRLGFFQKQFSLSGDEVRYLITRSPKLVTYNFEKFTEKLFSMKEEFGFSSSEMKFILLKKPKLWMLSRNSLKERFNILHNIMGLSHDRILEFPDALLTRGFILKQRHQYLVHLKRAQYNPEEPLYVSLKDLCTTSDSVFCEKCAKTSVSDFNEFLKTL
ncbi:transcription termination factor 3, mitochondrial [Parasteatoda tepidariorum]|uniref:transcription termination factor 3, mitochondrial n=1 Tax=Parasteatoda tepidariorum TaxID=114398 RepID=UPI00077F8C5C|nr:transcription termination factor 3, mitochondrial [Parasteatoda tepidariorum]XP_015910379.1 transcription termination factor 3, mitochondrial [Parasteatoda tepidariorum]XP_042907149.1 transcription termination factor 3, mitochondrial [Parasteatoda tepidariorum]